MDSRQLIVLIALAAGAVGNGRSCSAGSKCNANRLVIDVTSHRNATGHRHVKADVSMSESVAKTGGVHLQIEHESCAVSGQFHMSSLIIAPEPRVPQVYELVPGVGWYRLHLQPLTWEEARLACEAEGAHLAVLNSKEEAAALKGLFARAPDKIPETPYPYAAFIGYSDSVEGHYLTLFGETINDAGYAEWDTQQPNNAGGTNDTESDCGGINRTGKLNDMPCRSKMVYFCEYSS